MDFEISDIIKSVYESKYSGNERESCIIKERGVPIAEQSGIDRVVKNGFKLTFISK